MPVDGTVRSSHCPHAHAVSTRRQLLGFFLSFFHIDLLVTWHLVLAMSCATETYWL